MLALANLRRQVIVKQQSVTNAGTITSDVLDCQGADYLTLLVHGTTSDNATNNPSVLKVQQADTTDATNFADIAALLGDGASGFTIPNSPTATTNNLFAVLNCNLINKKRYIRVLISPLTTQTFSVVAELSRNEQRPGTAALQGAAVVADG